MDKQTKIIKSALKVLSKKYFGEVTLEEIAREAGLAKGTLYLYFKDKEDLYLKCVLFIIDAMKNIIVEKYDEEDKFFITCDIILKASVGLFKKNPEFSGLAFILHNPGLLKNRQKFFDEIFLRKVEFFDFLKSLVEKGKKEGSVRKNLDTEETAFIFMSLYYDLIFRTMSPRIIKNKKTAGDKSIKTALDIFKNGVLERPCQR
ncbi:TetR/AcrR family transcriptional regulator [candidate division WOR-3 bacterium]|nr:TetR/AcrR family transcriptional regulator [candidate division WOR-3 bacterium]